MFSNRLGEMVEQRPDAPETWPALVAGMGLSMLVTGTLFWFFGILPNLGRGHGDVGELVRFAMAMLIPCMIVTAMVWAAVWFGFVKRTGREVADKYFAILLATNLAAAGGVTWIKYAETGLTRELSAMESQWSYTQRRDIDGFIGEMNALRLGDIATPAYIKRDADLSESTARLKRARELVAKHRRFREQRVRDYRAKIAALKTSADMRSRVLAGFEAQRARSEPLVAQYFDANLVLIDEVEKLVNFLARNRSRWRLEDDMATFTDLDLYNELQGRKQHHEIAFRKQEDLRWRLSENRLLPVDLDLRSRTSR